jgi:fibronectin-binding autotransporter adhesin
LNYAGKFDAAVPHDGSAAPSHTYFHVDHPPAHAPADAIVVPDAHFLFNADFRRSGVDLILSGDDREVVLHDYFKGEKRAALASPDGAHLTGDIVNALTGHVDIAQVGTNPAAGQVIGHVTKLQGNATTIRNGVSIILNNGDNVEKGDVVQSGSDSTLGITFVDGTVFGLSSNARMVLNEMVYDPNGSNNSSLLSLVAGTISFVAGQTAKHGDMKIDTPVATMGIRGTAVLVQIDFTVPGQSGAPNASFQVLVEPDGTTGSYILFDKTTLQPIAMVNQAGQQININNGVISQSNAPLSPDVQKLIQDVFTQKFTDNSNTKQTSPYNDSVTPQQQQPFIKLADGATATPFVLIVNSSDPLPTGPTGQAPSIQHIPGPPTAVVLGTSGQVTTAFAATELIGKTGVGQLDSISGSVNFGDVNAGDQPTVKVDFSSFTYQNAKQVNVTATMSALQLADIAATEVKIDVVPDPNNKNNGSATWTYSIADKAFDFLAAGEQLTLTYLVRVDNNYAPNNESTTIPITITITGTNDVPVITTSAQTIAFSGGTSTPGGSLTSSDPTSGNLSFQDADLTDTHTVATKLTSAVISGSTVPPGPLALFEKALTASILTDSTGTGVGTIHWQLADLPVYLADFVPQDETLTLTYTVTVTDSSGTTSSQTVTVSITGTDNPAVVWIATTAPDSATGGFWRDGANWETGTVPTATDDVIIITDQLHGLTPSFPVTIDATAFANSVTMNDFSDGDSPPELINSSCLTIGTGGLNMGADSILMNSWIITVAGKTEIRDSSVLKNSGTLNLGGGGDFTDSSHITNTSTGKIEVAGGTLNVLVDIANAGKIIVDSGATLALHGGAIDGGKLSISGTLELEGLGVLKNGSLGNTGHIDVTNSGNAIDKEDVTNAGALEILAAGALPIDQGSSVDNEGGGTITVDGTAALAVNDATITGGTITNKSGGTIDLTGSGTLTGGVLNNSGQVNVSGSGNVLDGETVANTTTVAIGAAGVLLLEHGASIVGGKLTNFGTVHVETSTGATLDHVAVDNTSGAIVVDTDQSPPAKLTLDDGTTITKGTLTIGIAGTLEVSTTFGATLSGVSVDDSGKIQVDGGSVLTLEDTTIAGGLLSNRGGTVHIETAAGATFDHVTVDNALGTIAVDTDQSPPSKLILDGGTSIANGTLTVGINGTLEVSATEVFSTEVSSGEVSSSEVSSTPDATLSGVHVGNSGLIEIDAGAVLALSGSTITGGAVSIDGTLDATGTSSMIDANISIGEAGVVESTGGGVLTIDPDAVVGITNHGTLQANGGELDIVHEAVTNTGTLQTIDDSILKLVSLTVTNDDGHVSVEAQSTLDLIDAIIKGGTIDVAGTFDATGTSAIEDAHIDIANGGVLEVTGGTLTIDAASLIDNKGIVEASGGGTLIIDSALSGKAEIIGASVLELGALDAYKGVDITFADGSTGTLKIDHAETFAGTVSGLDDNTLDLGDITFCPHMIVSFEGTSSWGTLTIINPDDPTQVAHIHLDGDYLGSSWSLASDGYGGTDVTESPGVLSGLDSHGNAIEGTTVTASVTDGGQEVTSANYTFETLNDDGTTWKVVQDGTSDSYVPTEADEGRQFQVVVSYTDADDHAEKTRIAAGVVQEDPNENAAITLTGLTKGNAVEGVKVTATVTDSDAPKSGITYTWSVDGHVVKTGVGAEGSSYTPTEYDEGKAISVVVSFTDTHGFKEHGTASAGIVQDEPDSPPHIVGETDPATQTIILAESPIVLAAGTTTNSLGLHTETFDEVGAGSASNNGHEHGNFDSSDLNARFSASGNAGVVTGSSSVSAAPFVGGHDHQDTSHYLSIGANGAETISFATEQNAFGLYWGSVDSFNKIAFYNGDKLVASYTGADVSPLLANGDQTAFSANGYVEFSDLAPFNKVVLTSGSSNAFEIDNISAGYKSDHHIHLTEPITGTLTVSDDDIGDKLTASVTGPADIMYNGSSKLPAGVNFDALINPSAVIFNSVTSDGKADVLHWNYNPTNPDLDFLEPGDTLTITFHAQVNDGHATAGNQALTITLTGTGSSVVNGTAQNDVFDHVGGGVTIFGHGGNDTFAFNANFGSATIGDFNLDHDAINFDRSVFNSVQEFLDSAKSANFGLDTIITDANHDKIVLTGVNVDQLKAHPGDFHLV